MKKLVLGAVFILLISAVNASAAGLAPQKGQSDTTTGRNILSSELPVTLLADIKKDYKDFWITALSEEGKGRHADYSITLENADQIVQLRSSDSGKWVVTNTVEKAVM
jgi:hypothetical protein